MKLDLTAGGLDYLSHCLAGGPSPIFCKITIGNGVNAGYESQYMSNPLKDIPITEISRNGNFVTLTGVMNNTTVEERFKATEIGVYITDPDNENGTGTILFAYGYVTEEEAAVIPAVSDYMFETIENILVYVGATENVSAIISDSLVTASKSELRAHTDNNNNPHNVTASQVGLGNVENKSINDQTPKISLYDDFDNIIDGMTMKEILGRLVTLAIVYSMHEQDKDNPHGLTAASIGAAASKHWHNANDLLGGVLSVSRGGTGVKTMDELAAALGAYFKVPYFGVYTGDGSEKRLISLDFTPAAIILTSSRGLMSDDYEGTYGGIAIGTNGIRAYGSTDIAHATTWNDYYSALQIADKGFYVNYHSTCKNCTNKQGESYRYIAFR